MGIQTISDPCNTITASLRYLKWQELYNKEKPFQIFLDIPAEAEDQRESNLAFEEVEHQITDIRGKEKEFSLDKNGFQFAHMPVGERELNIKDRQLVEFEYLPKVEKLVKTEVAGADKVFIFDWRVRRDENQVGDKVFDINDPTEYLRPAEMVHIDQSPSAVLQRIRLQLPDTADFLLRGRVRVINVWRPLNHGVENFPLALCDGSSVHASDFVEADHVRRRYLGSTMYLLSKEHHKWVYLHNQQPDEVTVLKNFDSNDDLEARVAPHVAVDTHPSSSAKPRESIEVRCLVFSYPEDEPENGSNSLPSQVEAFPPVQGT